MALLAAIVVRVSTTLADSLFLANITDAVHQLRSRIKDSDFNADLLAAPKLPVLLAHSLLHRDAETEIL